MLSRAARRKHALRYLQQAADQIQLPWLCPALLQQPPQRRHTRSIASRPSIPHHAPATASSTPSRHLASAATATEDFDLSDDYLPFSFSTHNQDGMHNDPHSKTFTSQSLFSSQLEPLDLRKILMLDNTIALPPDRIRSGHRYGVEIRGDTREIETTLDACLQVQRWDRAFALLRQLGLISKQGSYQLIEPYNRTLEAMVTDLVWNRNRKNVDRINDWVEVDMKKAGVEPNAKTYALKIKVALVTLTGSKRDRTVRRYWQMARRYGFDGEVASLRGILTDSDLGKLSEIGLLSYEVEQELEDYEPELALEVSTEQSIAHKPSVTLLETEQKGLGLSTLKRSLSLFSEHKHLEDYDPLQHSSEASQKSYAMERQKRLESDAIESALSRWKAEHEKLAKMGISTNLQHGKVGALLWQWHKLMTEKLCKEMKMVDEAEAKTTKTSRDKLRCEYGPFLRLLKPDHIAAVTNIAALQLISQAGVQEPIKLSRLVIEVGKILETEVEAEKARKRSSARRTKPSDNAKQASVLENASGESKPAYHMHRTPHSNSMPYVSKLHWTAAIHARVGAILCELLFDTAKISIPYQDPVTGVTSQLAQPVFIRHMTFQNGKRLGTVSIHDSMINIMVTQPAGDMVAKQLPMVCPPRPWKGFYDGGFFESSQPFLRVKHQEVSQREYGEAAANRGDLDQLFAGLDVLSRTAWKINRDVFDVMLKAWNSGEAIANLPPMNKVFPTIPKPADDADAKARWEWYTAMRNIENEKGGLHSNRCFQNFQMEIAKAYLDETFYLPHNVDFRGRAYPIPPYLNQMGADNARGLLLFDRGRPLGATGLRWLKIHLANVYGFDKASLADREMFPMEHMEDITDSVNKPLDGKRWWLTAEDPWQCLAVSIELKKALDLPDPTQFVSHLPIHQDGSCNGLQHYAALGGDVAGAKQVNLEPGDKPADVYTGVAELVKAEIKQEAAEGHELAKSLDGKITRKIVKQTVMTNVYGVTFLGAIRQVRRQLDDLLPEFKEQNRSGLAATYIARKIFKGLGAMFSGAHDIQYWLGDCANRISLSLSPAQLKKLHEKEDGTKVTPTKPTTRLSSAARRKKNEIVDAGAFRSSVIWTTPLKLPVVQPYRVNKGQRIKTNLQDITLAEPSVADAVNKRKQLQAFPPNFIHSLDATHMILSALKADELGLSFSAVHDSFWTHAADVNVLNRLLREAFIRMHSEDIIGRLAAEFKMRYKGHLYLAQINRGSKLAKELQKYRKGLKYKPRSGKEEKRHFELMREYKRQKLLASDKESDRQEGQEMVTAASLFEELGSENDLYAKDSLGETAIGIVPEATSDATLKNALKSSESESGGPGMVMDEVDLKGTLDPLMQEQIEARREEDDVEYEMEEEAPAQVKKKSRPSQNQLWLWLPLKFREVPKKGDFDVTRLRESQYFFS